MYRFRNEIFEGIIIDQKAISKPDATIAINTLLFFRVDKLKLLVH